MAFSSSGASRCEGLRRNQASSKYSSLLAPRFSVATLIAAARLVVSLIAFETLFGKLDGRNEGRHGMLSFSKGWETLAQLACPSRSKHREQFGLAQNDEFYPLLDLPDTIKS